MRSESADFLSLFVDSESMLNSASIVCLLTRSRSVNVFDLRRVKPFDIEHVDEASSYQRKQSDQCVDQNAEERPDLLDNFPDNERANEKQEEIKEEIKEESKEEIKEEEDEQKFMLYNVQIISVNMTNKNSLAQ